MEGVDNMLECVQHVIEKEDYLEDDCDDHYKFVPTDGLQTESREYHHTVKHESITT